MAKYDKYILVTGLPKLLACGDWNFCQWAHELGYGVSRSRQRFSPKPLMGIVCVYAGPGRSHVAMMQVGEKFLFGDLPAVRRWTADTLKEVVKECITHIE